MVPVVSIVGKSESGKTTLLVKVVAELTGRGYNVGTIKHDAHGFEIDREGKDSWRHKKAGASTVALSSPERLAVIKDAGADQEWTPERIVHSFITDVDVVITEGFKKSALPKIEVIRKAVSAKPVCAGDKRLLAFVTDLKLKTKKPVFGLDESRKVADFIEDEIIKKHAHKTVSLFVNGGEVTLKPFIENLIKDGVTGMIRSLKGCAGAGEIEIKIRNR